MRQTRFFPDNFSAPILKYVYGNKVAVISLGNNLIGSVIDSPEIAEGEKAIFELIEGLSK